MRDHKQHQVRSDGSWLRRHAIAEDMGRALRTKRGDSSPMSFAPRAFTTSTLEREVDEMTGMVTVRVFSMCVSEGSFWPCSAAGVSNGRGAPV